MNSWPGDYSLSDVIFIIAYIGMGEKMMEFLSLFKGGLSFFLRLEEDGLSFFF